jgi:hypothetical protein
MKRDQFGTNTSAGQSGPVRCSDDSVGERDLPQLERLENVRVVLTHALILHLDCERQSAD